MTATARAQTEAEAFLPLLDPSGSYTTINGSAGFVRSPRPGVGAISATAIAQGTAYSPYMSCAIAVGTPGPDEARPDHREKE